MTKYLQNYSHQTCCIQLTVYATVYILYVSSDMYTQRCVVCDLLFIVKLMDT